MPSSRPCGRLVSQGGDHPCPYARMKYKQKCVWHWLLTQPSDIQWQYAEQRNHLASMKGPAVARVPQAEWPEGERWCAGCQSFVPLFYTSGSRCRACNSHANHERMVAQTYGLEPGDYDALWGFQDGRCYVCGRRSQSRRLAVDHDHETGVPRGLLCPDNERGCNHKVVGLLEANSVDGGLAAARRVVDYLEDPPYERLRRGETAPVAVCDDELGCSDPPPF